MISKSRDDSGTQPPPPSATIKRVSTTPQGMDVTLSLRNDGARAVHYIADIRTMRYDSAADELVIALSDSGRERLPSGVFRLPDFKYVDPGGEAELVVHVPDRIVRLTASAAPDGGPLFEDVRPTAAASVRVEVAWADTPYYEDARRADAHQVPTAGWQQGHAVATAAVRDGGPSPDRPKSRR